MDIFERWFEQDLTKKVGIQHAESLAFSGNNASNVVGVYVYKDGAPAELAGTVTGTVIRPDGMTVPLTGALDGNAVSITLTEACFAVPGYIGVALTVTSGDITMTVLKATFEVEPIETGTVVDPSGEITANVAELISDIEAAVAAIPPSYSDLLAAVAPTFDPEASTPYQSGAYVWYDGKLYQFTADHTGAWTGTDAVSVNVGEEISEVKSAINQKANQSDLDAVSADIDAVSADIVDIEEEVIIEKTPTEESTVVGDYGSYNNADFVQYTMINSTTGEIEATPETTAYRQHKANANYIRLPDNAVIFNYMHIQAITAVNIFYVFYDENKTYLGDSVTFNVTSQNVNDDTWNNYLGTYVTIPSDAKYVRMWTYSGVFHAIMMIPVYAVKVNIPRLVLDTDLTETDKPAQGKAVGDRLSVISVALETASENALSAKSVVDELTEKRQSANLFDSDFDESGYIDDANGDKPSSSYVRTSKYYPIDSSNSTLYSYNQDSGGTTNLLFYTSAKVFISRVNIAAESTSKAIPENAAYFRVYRNATRTGYITLTYEYVGHYIPYRVWTALKNGTVDYEALDNNAKVKLGNELLGRKILVFGDSIIGNDRTEGVCDYLAEYSGATIYNGAIGGTRITDLRSSQYDSPNYVYFDGVKLVHALMTNTWTDQDAHISDVSAYVGTETLPMLKALDCSTIDIVVLAYGRNDVTSSETAANIEAALETIVNDIQSHYPNIRVLVLTPIWGMFSSGTVDGDDYVNPNTNMTLRILADTFMSKAKVMHISSYDMLENMQLSENMMATYMDSDHVHLNSAGNAMYAHILHGKLRMMF